MLGSTLVMVVVGFILIVGIFLYGWLDYRRTTRVESYGNFGLTLVKNRLNGPRQ